MPTPYARPPFGHRPPPLPPGTVPIRRRLLVGVGAAAAAAAIWAGAATWYILARDEFAARFLAHQAELRYAYEDRIAGLKGQLEREVTQNLVERTHFDRRVDGLARRQAGIEARHDWLRRIAERSGAAEARVDPATIGSGGHAPVPPRAAASEPTGFGLKRLDQEAPAESGRPRDRLSVLEGSMDRIAGEELRLVEAVRQAAQSRLARLRKAIAVAGLDPTRFAGEPGAQGGPLIPLPAGYDGHALAPVAAETEARLSELVRLRDVARAMPLARPLAGDLDPTSGFGYRLDPFTRSAALHSGLDFRAEAGTPVRATGAGRVVEADWAGGYGQMIEIDHGGGVTTRYGHLSAFTVAIGARVETGQVIGRAGSTGRSTGPHLHYETRVNGEAINPQRFLDAGRLLDEPAT